MADNQQKQEALIAPEQPEAVRKANLQGVAPATGTASGLAAAHAAGIDLRGKSGDGGSSVPIAGGMPEPDLKGLGTQKEPIGAQAQAATFVSNGSIPANVGASNYGFVPVSQLDADPRRAHEIAKAQVESPTKIGNLQSDGPPRLTREQIERCNANELRAAAYDRGLDLGAERGSRGTRQAFIEAQNKHYGVEKGPDAGTPATTSGQSSPTPGSSTPPKPAS